MSNLAGTEPLRNGRANGSIADQYAEFLERYVGVLDRFEFNPYQSHLRIILIGFNPKAQWRIWKSNVIQDFLHVPNTVPQDLHGINEMLPVLCKLEEATLNTLSVMNGINLRRLQRRSALSWLGKLAIGAGGALGLISAVDATTPIELSATIPAFLYKLLIACFFGACAGGVLNIVILAPKIGLVRAFGDILEISKSYKSSSGNTDVEPR